MRDSKIARLVLRIIVKGIKKFNSGLVAIQRVFLFSVMGLITAAMFAEIVTRYFFGHSLFGLEQFVGFTAVWIYLIGSAYGAYERSHIKAEFIGVLVKNKRKLNIVKSVSAAVATFMSCVFAYWSYDFCLESVRVRELTPTHWVPMIYFQSALLVGAILMAAYFLWETIDFAQQAYHSQLERDY